MKGNSFLERMERQSRTGKTGMAAERHASKKMGGKLVPGSGSQRGNKGDIRLGGFLVEHKATVHNSISLDLGWLTKIATEALNANKLPALAITFSGQEGRPRTDAPQPQWVAVPMYVWRELIEGRESLSS